MLISKHESNDTTTNKNSNGLTTPGLDTDRDSTTSSSSLSNMADHHIVSPSLNDAPVDVASSSPHPNQRDDNIKSENLQSDQDQPDDNFPSPRQILQRRRDEHLMMWKIMRFRARLELSTPISY
ncbi:unnamed protein product [Ambrosiozyma monospora]|uniref:Unnamed protein product n=1 Tax=Ambrosiozyma monospora TaxID=43982 RepID=A0ACB5U960_AMBMO|nr:unnamed protein product [Ambrosiozyma monospora]